MRDLWSDEEMTRLGQAAVQDRLHPVITLPCGLRPEEVCSPRWRPDVHPGRRELAIQVARTIVDGQVA